MFWSQIQAKGGPDTYGAFSYSRSQVDRVVRYVMNQREHHANQTFKGENLFLLRKFDIAFKGRIRVSVGLIGDTFGSAGAGRAVVALATNILPRWGRGARWYLADQARER
jgi:hypothetical protein